VRFLFTANYFVAETQCNLYCALIKKYLPKYDWAIEIGIVVKNVLDKH